MTIVRRSTMKVQSRYRGAAHSKKKKKSTRVILVALFLICFAVFFTVYQVILSKSNGGKEAVTSSYRSFLKGGSQSGGAGDKEYDGNGEDVRPAVQVQMIVGEEEEVKEDQAEIPPIIIQNNHLPDNKKVKFHEDIFRDEDGEESVAAAAAAVVGTKEKEFPFDAVAESEPSYVFDPHHQMFHNYFKGKSGKVVEDMLMAHAYIYHHNATYGGCCGNLSVKMTAHEDLLDALGLKGVLRFKCPRDFISADTRTRRSVIPKDHYAAEDTRIWTPEYVDYLRSLVTYPEKRHREYTIVVHMLRGNSSPCKEKSRGFYSYLPNLHYQNLIDKYMQPGARVIIYTSAKSFEDLNEFRNRGYEVNTDTSLKDTWKEFVTADVFIMSRSDFSMVPAMVANGIVVYTPFWHHILRRWKRASKSIMKQTDEETTRLQETKCVFDAFG